MINITYRYYDYSLRQQVIIADDISMATSKHEFSIIKSYWHRITFKAFLTLYMHILRIPPKKNVPYYSVDKTFNLNSTLHLCCYNMRTLWHNVLPYYHRHTIHSMAGNVHTYM